LADGRKGFIISNASSIRHDAAFDTQANEDRRVIVDGEVRRFVNDWTEANPGASMKVKFMDMYGILAADYEFNSAYSGYLNTVDGPLSANPDDRHPSQFGVSLQSCALNTLINEISGGGLEGSAGGGLFGKIW